MKTIFFLFNQLVKIRKLKLALALQESFLKDCPDIPVRTAHFSVGVNKDEVNISDRRRIGVLWCWLDIEKTIVLHLHFQIVGGKTGWGEAEESSTKIT